MYLASAYPSDVISPWKMAAIVLAVAIGLGAWLIFVFIADRQGGRKKMTRHADVPTPVPAALDPAAEDEHSRAGHAPVDGRHGAAA
jgi:hypothetical protein